MREKSLPHCCSCLPCGHTGVPSCVVRTLSIFLFGRTLRISCFNFFNTCTYHSELIVAPLSKNYTNKISSLSQKTLDMTLPTEVRALNFFLAWRRLMMPFHWLFSSPGRNNEPRLRRWQLLSTDKNVSHSHCTGEVLHRYFLRAVLCSIVSIFGVHIQQKFCSQVLWWWPLLSGFQFLLRRTAHLSWFGINLFFGLRRRCRGWSASAVPVIIALLTAFKITVTESNWPIICGVLIIHASRTSLNLCRTGAFHRKKFSHHSLPNTYINNIPHYTMILCLTRLTDWLEHQWSCWRLIVTFRWVREGTTQRNIQKI